MKKIIHSFVIDRKAWTRGTWKRGRSNFLLEQADTGGGMCCLGFFLRSLGVSKEKLRSKVCPADVPMRVVPAPAEFLIRDGDSTEICNDLMLINDVELGSKLLVMPSEEYREKLLTKTFARQGIKVTFKG